MDWAAAFRARATELGWSHREVDSRAGLADGYFSKILAGMKTPNVATIAQICAALRLRPRLEVEPSAPNQFAALECVDGVARLADDARERTNRDGKTDAKIDRPTTWGPGFQSH
jgi:transcriptional regulator with XRE-family HTH domain